MHTADSTCLLGSDICPNTGKSEAESGRQWRGRGDTILLREENGLGQESEPITTVCSATDPAGFQRGGRYPPLARPSLQAAPGAGGRRPALGD